MAAVQDAFDVIAGLALDPTMPEIQYRESRRFFFAGVLWCITEFERQADQPNDPDGAKAFAAMQSMRLECERFGQSVKAGQA